LRLSHKSHSEGEVARQQKYENPSACLGGSLNHIRFLQIYILKLLIY
jgi:hypothetical protein